MSFNRNCAKDKGPLHKDLRKDCTKEVLYAKDPAPNYIMGFFILLFGSVLILGAIFFSFDRNDTFFLWIIGTICTFIGLLIIKVEWINE